MKVTKKNIKQWKPWMELLESLDMSQGDIFEGDPICLWPDGTPFWPDIPSDYRTLVALALSVAHWHPNAVPRGGMGDDCALCNLSQLKTGYNSCGYCPLSECGDNCNKYGSSWQIWRYSLWTSEKAAADGMYKKLMSLYRKEYYRLFPADNDAD